MADKIYSLTARDGSRIVGTAKEIDARLDSLRQGPPHIIRKPRQPRGKRTILEILRAKSRNQEKNR